ncbi:TetR/AcrR family transcriptional regulator [bacterium]|nr:TetR/AcrR family transcriptional regulator [bacterium]
MATSKTSNKQTLSAEDWADAALAAMADGGLEAVAVEPLARRLGVTKGSFYWHFANRDAVVRAAIELWAQRETDDIIEIARKVTAPRRRIQTIFKLANGSEREGRLYLAIAAASRDPMIGHVIEKVSRRRLEYLKACYTELGLADRDARKWATFAYSTFLGTLQLRRDDAAALSSDGFFTEYVRHLIEMLIPKNIGDQPPGEPGDVQPEERAA